MTAAALGCVLAAAAGGAAGAPAGREQGFPEWLRAAFPAFFVVMWVATCILIARLGGWSGLAAAYRAAEPFRGRLWRFKSGALRRFTGYNNCLTVGASEEGLYLAVLFLFRVGHPPLFIPWADITVETRSDKVLFVRYSVVEFRFSRVPGVPLRLQEGLVREIASALGMPLGGPGDSAG